VKRQRYQEDTMNWGEPEEIYLGRNLKIIINFEEKEVQ
jgi:hypothetical protein